MSKPEMKLYPASLRFPDPMQERGYVSSCHRRLMNSVLVGSIIVTLMTLMSLVHNKVLRDKDFTQESAKGLRRIIMGIWIAESVLFTAAAIWSRCRWLHRRTPLIVNEVVVAGTLSILIVGTFCSNRYYLAKLHGWDPLEVYSEESHYSDTALLLIVDAIITGSHLLAPIRWFVLVSTEIVALLVCGYGLFILGSPETSPFFSFACLTALTVTAGMGRRSQERSDRKAFKELVDERGLRYAAEHELSWARDQAKMSKSGEDPEDDAMSYRTGGTAETGDSGVVFGEFNTLHNAEPEEVLLHMERLVDMGQREHWLVNQADLKVWPDRIIGVGGFGCVVVADLHGTQVAMKLHRRKQQRKDHRFLTSIANELRVLRRLRHPHIVSFFGACVDAVSGEMALIFEWVKGGQSLDKYIGSWKSAPSTVCRHKVLLDISCALRYLHAQAPAVVHGDLKPSNILVEEGRLEPHAKLLDFGLSRVLGSRPRPLGGTEGWKAPETLVQPKGWPKPSADVFVFGLLAHFVITGKHPPDILDAAETKGEGLVEVSRLESMEWPQACPLVDECRTLCERCLDVAPAARPTMAAAHVQVEHWESAEATDAPESAPLEGCALQSLPTLEPRRATEPMNWRQGVETLMTMVCRDFEKSIAATFDIFDPSKEILSVSTGWQEFCGQSAAKHRSMFVWFPPDSELWSWIERHVSAILSQTTVASAEAGTDAGAGGAARTYFFHQVRGRRSEDPPCITYTAKVAVTFPEPAVHCRDAAGMLRSYVVTLSLFDVTTLVKPFKPEAPKRAGSGSVVASSQQHEVEAPLAGVVTEALAKHAEKCRRKGDSVGDSAPLEMAGAPVLSGRGSSSWSSAASGLRVAL